MKQFEPSDESTERVGVDPEVARAILELLELAEETPRDDAE